MSLRRGVTVTFLGYGAYAASGFIMTILLGKYDKAVLGVYSEALVTASPFMQLGAFGLTSIYASRAAEHFDLSDYLGLRVLGGMAAFVMVAVDLLLSYPGNRLLYAIGLTYLAGALCDRLAEMYFGVYQVKGRLELLSKSQLIRAGISLILFAVPFELTKNLFLAVLGSAIGSVIGLFAVDVRWASRLHQEGDPEPIKYIWPRFKWDRIGPLFVLALPLALAVFFDNLGQNFPRQFLSIKYGPNSLAQMQAYSQLITIMNLVVTAVMTTITPRFGAEWSAKRYVEFKSVLRKGILFVAILSFALPILAVVAGGPLLEILFNKSYIGQPTTFAVVVLSGSIGYFAAIVAAALTAAKVLRAQAGWMLACAVVALISSPLFVMPFGILGAGFSLILVAIVKLSIGAGLLWMALRKAEQAADEQMKNA